KNDAQRQLDHEVHAQHRHAGDPEEEDVEPGLHHGVWVERLQRRRAVRPAEGGERPEPGREPGLEDVRILPQLAGMALRAARGWLARDRDVAGIAVPGGDPTNAPELARDAPLMG